jgi:hypothetical protein
MDIRDGTLTKPTSSWRRAGRFSRYLSCSFGPLTMCALTDGQTVLDNNAVSWLHGPEKRQKQQQRIEPKMMDVAQGQGDQPSADSSSACSIVKRLAIGITVSSHWLSRRCVSLSRRTYFNHPPSHNRLKTIQRPALTFSALRIATRSLDARRPSDHPSVVNGTIVIHLNRNRSHAGWNVISIHPMIKHTIELAPSRPTFESLQTDRRHSAPIVQTLPFLVPEAERRDLAREMNRSATSSLMCDLAPKVFHTR